MIADALFRVASLKSEHKDYGDSLSNIEKIPVHHITQTAPASPERLQELHEATDKDPSLRLLAKTVNEGWSKNNQRLSPQYTILLVFQRPDHMWRWNDIQRDQTNNAQIRKSINSESSTYGALCNSQDESQS